MLDRSEDLGVSSYKIAELYGLDASTIRARFNRKLEDIEGQLGKYCSGYNALAYYPQSASRPVYNIISVGMPIAERLTEPRLRDIQQPYSPESKAELAVMQVLAWARVTAASSSAGCLSNCHRALPVTTQEQPKSGASASIRRNPTAPSHCRYGCRSRRTALSTRYRRPYRRLSDCRSIITFSDGPQLG